MVNNKIPAEWQENVGNYEYTNNNKLIQNNSTDISLDRCKRLIVKFAPGIPELNIAKRSMKKSTDVMNIDSEFKERPDALPNSHFKDMPRLIVISENTVRGIFEPCITGVKDDLIDRDRKIIKAYKKNDIGIHRTLVKNLTNDKVHATDETQKVSQKNKLHHQHADGDRDNYTPVQIVPVKQYMKTIGIKS